MDYEKKYKEALEWMREIYPTMTGCDKEDAEHHFPELKDSDGERIRKALLEMVHDTTGDSLWIDYNVHKEDAIAWLEKRGEQKPQGKTAFEAKQAAEKADNQNCIKSADKVEPKFHEGDWLCENEPNNYARFVQILETVNVQGKERYRISRDINNDEDIVEFDFVEKYYHKFDIQDAKEGDVLSFDNEDSNYHSIGIFKRIASKNELNGNTYRCYVRYGGFEEKLEIPIDGDELHHCGTSAHPATKEQRDLLFAKMKETGYEWDAEKKELKKIEQSPVDVRTTGYWHVEDVEQKPSWSEEDERRYNEVRSMVHGTYVVQTQEAKNSLLSWLKFLKDRVQPQNKWKELLATANLENSLCDIQDTFSDTSYEYRILGEAIEFIRCTELKPQWKPSDEQMKALGSAIHCYAGISPTNNREVYALEIMKEQLKKLKEE